MRKHTIYKSEEGMRKIQNYYQSYLESLPFNFDRNYVDTRFGKTHTLTAGPVDGKPIFIFQGGNCINPMTLSWFTPLIREYRIYAPDTIGHPGYSDETRVSAKDDSFALWINDLMEHFHVGKSAFIGPSYGAGIILRLATFHPEKIACSVLVSPAGIKLGSKIDMIRRILLPLLSFNLNSSEKSLEKIANVMSSNSMKELDKRIIGEIFKSVRLEQDMPKLTTKSELANYLAPTMLIVGKDDIFFPEKKIINSAEDIIPNLNEYISYDMGHFPSGEKLIQLNRDIRKFLGEVY